METRSVSKTVVLSTPLQEPEPSPESQRPTVEYQIQEDVGSLAGEVQEDNQELQQQKQEQEKRRKLTHKPHTDKRVDSFQREIHKWEDFYDDMKTYLSDGTLNPRNKTQITRQAETFFLATNGQLYYTKKLKDGPATLLVVRSHDERMRVCRNIHLSTGEDHIHHRRDIMLELLGQQYYWKGQRRDVCQCIALCEMCSVGLGGKRRAKPPGQKRDISPAIKLPRIDYSPHPPTIPTTSSLVDPTNKLSLSGVTTGPAIHPLSISSSSSSSSSFTSSTTITTLSGHKELRIKENVNTHTTSQASQSPTQTGTVSLTFIPNRFRIVSGVPESPPIGQEEVGREQEKVMVQQDKTIHSDLSNVPTSSLASVDPLANLYTIAEACLLNNVSIDNSSSSSSSIVQPSQSNTDLNIASEVTVSDNSALQIFTTIDEPYSETQTNDHVMSCDQMNIVQSAVCAGGSIAMKEEEEEESCVVQTHGKDGDGATVDEEKKETNVEEDREKGEEEEEEEEKEGEEEEKEKSIYKLLFQLPSEPNTSLGTAVIESMQLALMTVTDPYQLAQAASQSLTSIFDLSPSSSTSSSSSSSIAVILPSRGAAYLTSLSSILTHQGLMHPHTHQTNPTPPIILYDAACPSTRSSQPLAGLLGLSNCNLGTSTMPMSRDTLQATVDNNRISAIVIRPYESNTSRLSLRDISSICHPRDIFVIVDCSVNSWETLPELRAGIKKLLKDGADMIMLPTMEHYQGPTHACVLIGRANLLAGWWERLSWLQSTLPLPLLCSPYDTVGCVVAFKSMEVTETKS